MTTTMPHRELLSRPVKALPLLVSAAISAGFPSPADDYVEGKLDLNERLIRHPSATVFVKVRGQSMIGAGIHDGDMLIVDRALPPRDGAVIVAVLNGEFTVKRLRRCQGKITLQPENQAYRPIEVTPETDFQVWGVVAYVIHQV